MIVLGVALSSSTSAIRGLFTGLLLVRGIVGVAQIFFFYAAIQSIPLVDAVLLRAASPLWVALIHGIVLRQPIASAAWFFLLIGFIGVAFVIHPKVTDLALGYAFGLGSGFLHAVQGMLSRQLHKQGEPLLRILIFVMGVGTCAFFVPAINYVAAMTALSLGLGIAVGLSLLLATACAVQAFRFAPAYVVTPFSYSSVVASALFGWWLFDHVPSLVTWCGIFLVALGAVGVARTARTVTASRAPLPSGQ